jgi:hypothetical protein
MNSRGLAAAIALSCVLLHVSPAAAQNDATLLRVFLRDGTSLVSYGEFARVADRVIFSLPTSPLPNPLLQLVNLPAGRIDWERTNRYADAARAARYTATQAEADYVALSNAVARTLDNVGRTTDPMQRLAVVESARKTLADWPRTHFNYRVADVHQMLSMLDEAIADLRAAAGGSRFEFSLTAVSAPPVAVEPLLPAPSPVESIDQLILAASLADAPGERQALLNLALTGLNRSDASLPANWTSTTRAKVKLALDAEVRIDRSYQMVIRQALAQADTRARFADVRGIQHREPAEKRRCSRKPAP